MTAYRYHRFYVCGAPGGYHALAEINLRESPAGANVSSLGTWTSSSAWNGSWIAPTVADGNTSTFWHTASQAKYGEWIQVDFGGTPRDIVEAVITARAGQPSQAPTTIIRAVSNDGVDFPPDLLIHTATWVDGVAQTFTSLTPVANATPTQYYELFFPTSHDGTYAVLGEINLNNGGANLLLGSTATASSTLNGTTLASKAINAGADTVPWHSAAGLPAWWRSDLGGSPIAHPTGSLILTSRADSGGRDQSPTRYFLARSNNLTVWTVTVERSMEWSSTPNVSQTFPTEPTYAVRSTAVGAEAWFETSSPARITAVGAEVYFEPLPPPVRVTAVGAEIWMNIAPPPPADPFVPQVIYIA
jgi:hypothetical protein